MIQHDYVRTLLFKHSSLLISYLAMVRSYVYMYTISENEFRHYHNLFIYLFNLPITYHPPYTAKLSIPMGNRRLLFIFYFSRRCPTTFPHPAVPRGIKGTHNQSQSIQTQIIKSLFSIQICSINLTLDTVKV